MGMIFLAFVYLPRIILMFIVMILKTFYPIWLAFGLYFICKFLRKIYNMFLEGHQAKMAYLTKGTKTYNQFIKERKKNATRGNRQTGL